MGKACPKWLLDTNNFVNLRTVETRHFHGKEQRPKAFIRLDTMADLAIIVRSSYNSHF